MYCIKHLYYIDASNDEVFNALTTIEGLSNWWTEQTSGNPELEGVIEFRFGKQNFNKMKVETIVENKAVRWKCIDGHSDWINTIISFELDTNENKTRLRFAHNNWPTNSDFFSHCSFSWARYLESLRQLLEKGKGQPFKT
ncbi:MAG: SRPBCC domain-containing protein [Flavobacteriaceae bacterium]|nr:SRPBCC domain-containing protein [Flavobacteriaceae bacterium]